VCLGGGGWAGLPGRQGEVLEQHQVELSTLNTVYDSSVAYDLIHTYIWTCILRIEDGEAHKEKIQINTNSFFKY
jgi:hypothetical protein